MLEEFVKANPADAFARYGLAMECAKLGETSAAEEHFRALLAAHPDYIYGYYHYGQLLMRLERQDEARNIFTEGIAAAEKARNAHGRDELEAALRDLS
jgi:predicted Zn-dependent protease